MRETLKRETKNLRKQTKGITLIALVITIIVLLILAAVSIATLTGDHGILTQANKAKEEHEMAQIKEEADLIKLSLNMEALTGKNGVSFIEKSKLISELKKHFEGSTIEAEKVVVKEGKYDIIVKNNLDIVVVKHGENYLKDDEIGITYEIQDLDVTSKKIKVYLEVGEKGPTEEGYKQFANKYLSNKSTAELEELALKSINYIGTFDQYLTEASMTREQIEQMAQEQEMTYDEYWKYGLTEGMGEYSWVYTEYLVQLAGGEGKTQTELENLYVELIEYPKTFDEFLTENGITRDDLPTIAQEQGFRTEEDFIKDLVTDVYKNKANETITVQCSNGESKTTNVIEAYVEFTVTKNGTYTIVATTESGKRGEINVEITGIIEEKFSQIYTETKEYVDSKGDKATIPAGFAVGVSEEINTIEKGLVITDSVDSEGRSNGNEFVWIPVLDSTPYARNTTYADTDVSTTAYDDTDYLPDGVTKTEERLVKDAGGFYIARYEAGQGTKPVSKKGVTVWVSIAQETAKSKAKEFINNNYVKSALISGIQWDMTMSFISSKPRVDGTGATYDVREASNTRHRGYDVGVAKSGQNIADKVCNIYDLEGNAYDVIAEKHTSAFGRPYVFRGGSFAYSFPASYRGDISGGGGSYYSFRLALYVMQD